MGDISAVGRRKLSIGVGENGQVVVVLLFSIWERDKERKRGENNVSMFLYGILYNE